MAIRFYCPIGHRLHAPESQQGKLVHCPACGQRVIVPLVDLGISAMSHVSGLDRPTGSSALSEKPGGWDLPADVSTQSAPLPPVPLLEPVAREESLEPIPKSGLAQGGFDLSCPRKPTCREGSDRGTAFWDRLLVSPRNPPLPEASEGAGNTGSSWGVLGRPEGDGVPSRGASAESPGMADAIFPLVELVSLEQREEPPELRQQNMGESGCLEDFFLAEECLQLPPENVLWGSVLEEIIQGSGESAKQEGLPTDFSAPILEDQTHKEPTQQIPPIQQPMIAQASDQARGDAFGEAPKLSGVPIPQPTLDGENPEEPLPLAGDGGWGRDKVPTGRAASPKNSLPPNPHVPPPAWMGRGKTAKWRSPAPVDQDSLRQSEVRWLALWLSLIVLFSIGPAFRHLLLSLAPGWARTVVLVGLCQLAYVVWMRLTVHRTAIWIVMGVFAAGATLSALTTALTLVASDAKLLPGSLGQIRPWAASWFGCVLSLQTLGAYLAGRLAFLWGQKDKRFARHQPAP